MKALHDTLKDLYEEVPRNWCRVRVTENTYQSIRRGCHVIIKDQPRYDLQDLQIYVDSCMNRDDVLSLYDRHNHFVRNVEFSYAQGDQGTGA
jgi:hypothetical protein